MCIRITVPVCLVLFVVCVFFCCFFFVFFFFFFFFQAEDGIRDAQESRGLGDVYKRQVLPRPMVAGEGPLEEVRAILADVRQRGDIALLELSLIHI